MATLVFLPGKFHGQRSLAGYGPWGHKESTTTEATDHACMHTCRQGGILKGPPQGDNLSLTTYEGL